MSGDLLVFEEIKKLSESSNKKLTDVNIERLERNSDVLFVLPHNGIITPIQYYKIICTCKWS